MVLFEMVQLNAFKISKFSHITIFMAHLRNSISDEKGREGMEGEREGEIARETEREKWRFGVN